MRQEKMQKMALKQVVMQFLIYTNFSVKKITTLGMYLSCCLYLRASQKEYMLSWVEAGIPKLGISDIVIS